MFLKFGENLGHLALGINSLEYSAAIAQRRDYFWSAVVAFEMQVGP